MPFFGLKDWMACALLTHADYSLSSHETALLHCLIWAVLHWLRIRFSADCIGYGLGYLARVWLQRPLGPWENWTGDWNWEIALLEQLLSLCAYLLVRLCRGREVSARATFIRLWTRVFVWMLVIRQGVFFVAGVVDMKFLLYVLTLFFSPTKIETSSGFGNRVRRDQINRKYDLRFQIGQMF